MYECKLMSRQLITTKLYIHYATIHICTVSHGRMCDFQTPLTNSQCVVHNSIRHTLLWRSYSVIFIKGKELFKLMRSILLYPGYIDNLPLFMFSFCHIELSWNCIMEIIRKYIFENFWIFIMHTFKSALLIKVRVYLPP